MGTRGHAGTGVLQQIADGMQDMCRILFKSSRRRRKVLESRTGVRTRSMRYTKTCLNKEGFSYQKVKVVWSTIDGQHHGWGDHAGL